jgi:hypothetical protein
MLFQLFSLGSRQDKVLTKKQMRASQPANLAKTRLRDSKRKKMDIAETLEQLKKKALSDPELRQRLLNTRNSKTPLADFCRISTKAGLPLYEMDIIEYGESSYAAMKRSTNGGGENSPALSYEDDPYEMFLGELDAEKK